MSVSLEHYVKQHRNSDIKVAFFDVDGTLLDAGGNYPKRLAKSLRRAQALGVKTAVASGRPYFATQFLWHDLGLVDTGVFCTGAQIFEPKTGKVHRSMVLSDALVRSLLSTLRNSSLYYELYTKNGIYVERDVAPDILAVHAAHLRATPTLMNFDLIAEPVVKLLVGADTQRDNSALSQLERQFPECTFAYAALPAYPSWSFASIIDKAACKRSAYDYLIDYYQVKSENVISFGDAQSDMAFISMAGIGVAMGNASAAVKAVADIVTAPVWDDGVADVLDALIA
ncbi:MAG TPA: HAD family hydrolase [Marinagarivorans sp.]